MGDLLRVAVIGLGLIGRRRAEALSEIEGATLAATVDPAANPAAGAASDPAAGATADPAADRRSAPHYATLAELPADLYDAAVIAVPHDLAFPIAAQVLQCGRAVLVEKPLCVRGGDARALEALAAELPRPSFVGYNYRYLPAISELLRAAEDGALGELRSVEMLVGHGGHPRSATGWKLDPVRAGGGVLLDPGVHLLDLLCRLAPAVTCTNIEATRGFWPTGIEEDLVATFRSERLLATVRVSHIRWVNTFRVEAFGEDGYAIAEGRGGNYGPMRLRRGRRWGWAQAGAAGQRDSEQTRDFGARDESLRDELAAVVARWRGEQPEPTSPQPATFSEGRRITELCEQLYERISTPENAAPAPSGLPASTSSSPIAERSP